MPTPTTTAVGGSRWKPDSGYNTSQQTGAGFSGPAWWTVDTQSCNARHIRMTDIYNSDKITGSGTPTYNVENYVEFDYNVETRRDVTYTDFSSTYYVEQGIDIISDSASGGFGMSGVTLTVSGGYKRYQTRIDANGNPEDTSQICSNGNKLILQKSNGYYDPSMDTSATIGPAINTFLQNATVLCPAFDPNLVKF